jgi:putative ABC transport system permease protein
MSIADEFDNFTYDIMTMGQTNDGKPLNEGLASLIEDIDGVEQVEPFILTMSEYNDNTILTFGYIDNAFSYNYEDTQEKGRWLEQNDHDSEASVLVIGKALANVENIGIGDKIELELATGPHTFEVVGINSGQMNNGMVAYMPFDTLQNIMMWNDTVSGFSIITTGESHDVIDRVSTQVEDELLASGYVVDNEIMYVMEEQNIEGVGQIMTMMMAVGSLVIVITMIGLMSTLTMNVLERTKEIGMMRCIGSKSGHIRNMFGSEGLTLGLIGWVVGIPVGYLIGLYLNHMIYNLMHFEMTYLFPVNFIVISLLITVVVSVVVIQPPLWRATHFRPGDALRYE